jgi:hypothetical protein
MLRIGAEFYRYLLNTEVPMIPPGLKAAMIVT